MIEQVVSLSIRYSSYDREEVICLVLLLRGFIFSEVYWTIKVPS